MLAKTYALAACVVLWAVPALAWGPEGHQIIAQIAARELTAKARVQVVALLGGDAEAMMVTSANWADEIRDARPQTAPWHFVDIELEAPGFDRARDCPRGACTVAQIERDRQILLDRTRPRAERAEALKFLIHFMGDVHQPLHSSDHHDRGGNDIKLRLGRMRTSLHHVWDTPVVEELGDDAAVIATDIRARLTPQQKTRWQSGTMVDWTNESFRIARDRIYPQVPPSRPGRTVAMPRDYIQAQTPIVRDQLAKAGLRLAWTLNTIWK